MLVQLEIGPLKALYRLRKNKTHLEVQVSQGFMGAEPELLGALAADMVLGKQPQRSQQIRAYSTSEDYTEIELAMELMVEELIDAAKGHTYNLTQLFDQLNHTYFQGGLTQPRLYWSTVATRRKFGHYQPSGDRVMISQTLDSPKVPEWVVEFVLYHELLHKYHGETWSNGRRLVHTPAFRQDEKRYHAYAKAQAWLNKLAH
jgi:predicted metal-dependent hydrolase